MCVNVLLIKTHAVEFLHIIVVYVRISLIATAHTHQTYANDDRINFEVCHCLIVYVRV